MKSDENRVIIFCDGACSGNPGAGGWGSIVAFPTGSVVELGAGHPQTTNNQMELTAVIEALRLAEKTKGPIDIYTDSTYVIRGITQWVFGWQRRGWKTAEGKDVANQDLWQELSKVVQSHKGLAQIKWHYVRGHTGVPGNERCDEIAVCFSKGESISLYSGNIKNYAVSLNEIPEDTTLPDIKPKEAGPKKAICYLSLLGGTALRHATWSECERRVKGQSGAKFKKAHSEDEVASILSSWGIAKSALKPG